MIRMHDCAYCGGEATRIEPFGDEACCDHCFNALIGDANHARPWACGNEVGNAGTES